MRAANLGLRTTLWWQRHVRRRRSPAPLLSVVVPVYDMEPFLAECLESLAAQTFTDFEAIVVVDGATDRSLAIALDHARDDRRFRVVHQTNAGLGATRNRGIALARGTYLTFADSDDTLPPDAYAHLVGTIERTGSDFVVGSLSRADGPRRHTLPLMRLNHRWRRERVTLDEMPLILADVFPVNKVFRRSFWDDAGLAFPEGIRYEDQPTMTQAFLSSTVFDVIPENVYLWRTRPDRSSITQGRHRLEDLADRLTTKQRSTELVLASGRPGLLDVWFKDVLPVDMWEYCRAAPTASEEYWELLRQGLRSLWNESTCTFDHTRVPAQQRLMGWLVSQGHRQELTELVEFIDGHRGDVPIEMHRDHVVARLPGTGRDRSGPPETTYVLGPHEHRWEGRVTATVWQGSRLVLEGFALIRNAPTDGVETELTGALVPACGDDDPQPMDLTVEHEPLATKFVGRASQNFDGCGFEATVDLARLVPRPGPSTTWRFELRRSVRAISATGGVTHLHGADVEQDWHQVEGPDGAARMRLRESEGHLVLDCVRA